MHLPRTSDCPSLVHGIGPMLFLIKSPRRGFTLIECLVSLLISLVLGLATIGSVIYTRQSLEIDKQRLAALNYCRQSLEAAQTHASIPAGVKPLVIFNDPGVSIDATVSVDFFPLLSNGEVDWSTPLKAAIAGTPTFCRVGVDWVPAGTRSLPQKVSMSCIVRAGTR